VESAHQQGLHVSLNLHRAPATVSTPAFTSPTTSGPTRRAWMPSARTGPCGQNATAVFPIST
jgi:hypothetical protein